MKRKPKGRPIRGAQKCVRYLVTLEPTVAARLRTYGKGNLSAGITRAANMMSGVSKLDRLCGILRA